MGGYGADYAANMHQNSIEEKAKLFEYLMKNMNKTSVRSPDGKRTLTWVTHGQGHCEEAKKVLKYQETYADKRSRDERYAEYLKLREEFEGNEGEKND